MTDQDERDYDRYLDTGEKPKTLEEIAELTMEDLEKPVVPLTIEMINAMQDIMYTSMDEGGSFWYNTNSKASTCEHEGLYESIKDREMPHPVHIKCSNCGTVISFIGSILYNRMREMFSSEFKDWKSTHVMKTPKPMKVGSLYGVPIFVSADIPEEHICFPDKAEDGSFTCRLSGDHPIDCGTCNEPMSFDEFMENDVKLNGKPNIQTD